MAEAAVDVLLVTSLPNILYLTNFSGTAAIVVVDRERIRFITDARYVSSVDATRGTASACPDLELTMVAGSYDATLADVLTGYAGLAIGFESAHLSVARFDWLRSTSTSAGRGDPFVATQNLVEAARVRKDAYEIAMLREGGKRLSSVAAEVFTFVRTGRTEQEIAADIDWQIRQAGFERPAFDTIVAAGPNSALPHARPSERRLGKGDLVVLDFGGVYGSYCVDLTRTVAMGPASPRARSVYEAVRRAQACAIAATRPGASRFAIDEAARSSLEGAEMGDAFGHGTGHGLGIEIHEDPRVVQRRAGVDTRHEAVDVGMVFTLEPGAYFPGWGGVRIEDDIVVTEHGGELLTNVTRELLEL